MNVPIGEPCPSDHLTRWTFWAPRFLLTMRLVIRARPCGLQPYPTGVILGTVEINLSQLSFEQSTKGKIFVMFGLISEEGCCDRGSIDWNCPPSALGGQERLYDRTRSSRSVFVTALSGHLTKTIGYGAGSLKRGSSPIYSIRSLIESGIGAFSYSSKSATGTTGTSFMVISLNLLPLPPLEAILRIRDLSNRRECWSWIRFRIGGKHLLCYYLHRVVNQINWWNCCFILRTETEMAATFIHMLVVSQMRFHRRREPTRLVARMTNSYPRYLNVSSMLAWSCRSTAKRLGGSMNLISRPGKL